MLNVNTKINKELAIIGRTSFDYFETLSRQKAWLEASKERILFIEGLRQNNIRGKAYSEAVAIYDKENMVPLWKS